MRPRRRLALLIPLSLRSQTSRVEDGVWIYHLEEMRHTESLKKEFLSSLRSITFERTPRFGFISNPKKKRDRRREEKLYSKGVWGGSLKMADGDDNKCKRKKGWIVQVRDDLQGEYRVVYAPIRVRAVTDNPERGWVAACVRGGLITEDRRWDLSVGTQRLKADPTR